MGIIKRKTITIGWDFDMDEISDKDLDNLILDKIIEISEHKACIDLMHSEKTIVVDSKDYWK